MVEHALEKLALAFDATFFPIEARKKGMKKSFAYASVVLFMYEEA